MKLKSSETVEVFFFSEDFKTFVSMNFNFLYSYNYNDEMRIGGFTWNMEFRWRSLSSKEADSKRKLGAPYATPTFNGTYVASSQFLSQIEYKNMPQYAQERNDLELSFRVRFYSTIGEQVNAKR